MKPISKKAKQATSEAIFQKIWEEAVLATWGTTRDATYKATSEATLKATLNATLQATYQPLDNKYKRK